MKFWWVNHGRMFRRELAEGYIWCPALRDGDIRRESWLTMRRVRAGDMVFSYADQKILAVGIATKDSHPAKAREGYSGWWNDEGLEVAVSWTRLSERIAPKQHIDEIRPLLRQKHAPLRANGDGNVSYLHEIDLALARWLIARAGLDEDAVEVAADQAETRARRIPETQKLRLQQARIGQGQYRVEVLKVETSCRLTGVSDPSFLIASHIKPWRSSDDDERLDGHNGLMLSPHVDKLFDKGWISFAQNGDLQVHIGAKNAMRAWGLPVSKNVGRFSSRQTTYLEWHREHVFAYPKGLHD
jgi:hypothetical protein